MARIKKTVLKIKKYQKLRKISLKFNQDNNRQVWYNTHPKP